MSEYHKLILWQVGTIILTVGMYYVSRTLGASHVTASAFAVAVPIIVTGAASFVAMRDSADCGLAACIAIFTAFCGCGLAVFIVAVACGIIPPFCSPVAKFNAAGILILCVAVMFTTGALVSIKESVDPRAAISTGCITLADIIGSLAFGSAYPGLAAIVLLGSLSFKTHWG